MILRVYDCPRCGGKVSLPDDDAQLLAAAPDLLEACEAALWRMEQYDYGAMQQTMDKLRAAIRKDKGE